MLVSWVTWVSVRLVATLVSERDLVTIEDPERSNSSISVKVVIDSRYSAPVRVMSPVCIWCYMNCTGRNCDRYFAGP